MPERESGLETPQQHFEREVVEPTKRAMYDAMAKATSEKDANQKIKEALPKDRSFLGPLVMYMEVGGDGENKQRNILALVQTLDDQHMPVNIEAQFIG
ncbi:MAG: hypothetical protein UU48_C0006G0014 [Candidatus Uhrbacteria bacterium GW2011_GWF2_41_16]|uniref:Uncharacterized protein n=2 Tax=Candidatus Uhriibacteriota TaxID=1752732 RepID=A0A0G0VAN9_9BACT|nr:MAG: hypothetical protein UU35_C0015G0009 [Candidatus Uhrbacteria bacterium GW2011_GWC2_41_11]KKR97974.1 MAG: hypothetical protein UU48_C0006G0014 [Candidatus Uhrbacteria bacterium GW2011_GWF2_41_16]